MGLGTEIFIGAFGLITLIMAAEIAVKKILSLANHYGFSATFAGLTVFSVSTSLPEIFAHLTASGEILAGTLDYKIASATVLGANIGSDVIQQTLLLGLVVLLMGGFVFKRKFLLTAYLPMIGTTLLTLILGWDRTLSRLDGAILLGAFVAYMYFLYKKENHNSYEHVKKHVHKGGHVTSDIVISILSIVVMLFSAHFLLNATEQIVLATGIGGSLIGVVSLGVASAAPEFFTAISGVRQKAAGISLGTLIGSNITNPLVAIGGGALISTYWTPKPLIYWDLPMETITAALLLLYLWKTKGKLGKGGAWYLIGLYVFYIVMRIIFFGVD